MIEITGKIKYILRAFVEGEEVKNGGWIGIEAPKKVPEELITNPNEVVIVKDLEIEDAETTKLVKPEIAIFVKEIPKDFEVGKEVKIKIEVI